RLQPLYEQLLLPVHRKEDNVVIEETSLSDYLNVVHARVQKLKEGHRERSVLIALFDHCAQAFVRSFHQAMGLRMPDGGKAEDHGTSGDDGASTGGKSLAALYSLLERSTLAVEVGVTAATTMLFVTSFVTPTPEREGGGNTDSVFGPNLRTQRPSKSLLLPPLMMTASVTTTNVVGASFALVLRTGEGGGASFLGLSKYFFDSAPIGATGPDVAGPSNPVCTQLFADTFYVSQEMDFETLPWPSWPISQLRSMKYDRLFAEFNVGIEYLEEEKNALAGKVTTLEFAAIAKETKLASLTAQTAKLTQDISSMELSCDELGVKAASLEAFIGLTIDKGIQDRLVAGIDYGKAKGLKSQKDASIADIMSLLRLEGPSTVTLDVSRLQPLYEQLILPVHRKEDNVVIEETSLSDSLNVVHARVQKLKKGTLSHHLFISDAMGVLYDQLSSKNLISEASTSGVPITAAATTTLAISVNAANISPIPPISMANYDLFGPSFPPSSAWLASLLQYTKSPGLKLVLQTLKL
nr:hypothetical protein [Tanacetum cinerariifolium]